MYANFGFTKFVFGFKSDSKVKPFLRGFHTYFICYFLTILVLQKNSEKKNRGQIHRPSPRPNPPAADPTHQAEMAHSCAPRPLPPERPLPPSAAPPPAAACPRENFARVIRARRPLFHEPGHPLSAYKYPSVSSPSLTPKTHTSLCTF
jgi:hypothetical protein